MTITKEDAIKFVEMAITKEDAIKFATLLDARLAKARSSSRNPNCDSGQCEKPDGEVRGYPIHEGRHTGFMRFCRHCFEEETAMRYYMATQGRFVGSLVAWSEGKRFEKQPKRQI